MSIRILKPGFFTTIQDEGRVGYQQYGVSVGGAMDRFAFRLANILIGNLENSACLEITYRGAELEFKKDTLIAITGADLGAEVDGRKIPCWRPVLIKKDSIMTFESQRFGSRSYLAVGGGFDVPLRMGSASTDLKAGFGGFEGRKLAAGDCLRIGKMEATTLKLLGKSLNWGISEKEVRFYKGKKVIRFTKGKEYGLLTKESSRDLVREEFMIRSDSDRMGFRLKGPTLELSRKVELISEAVNFGTVQLPPNGHPIILMADRQTIGGYPKIAQIVSVDLPLLAQSTPGEEIIFQEISHIEAQKLYVENERFIRLIKKGVQWR